MFITPVTFFDVCDVSRRHAIIRRTQTDSALAGEVRRGSGDNILEQRLIDSDEMGVHPIAYSNEIVGMW